MKTIPRSLSDKIVRLFIAIGVVVAFIGMDVSTAAGDDPPDSIVLVPDYTVSAANLDGVCGDTPTVSMVTMTPQDSEGDVIDPGMGVTFFLPTGSPVVFLNDPAVDTPDADGAYSVQVTSPVPGVFEVGAALADGSHATSVHIPFPNGPLDPDRSVVTVTEGTRLADDNDPHIVTLTLVSQCGLPIDLAMSSSDALTLSAVDAASGDPVTVSRPPVDPGTEPGLTFVGYFQTSPGTYNALLVSNRPGTYDLTATFSEQTSYSSAGADQITTVNPSPVTVQFVSAAPNLTGTLTADPTAATAMVVDDQGTPVPGVDVSFQITGAQFEGGETAMTVSTDDTGRALAPITVVTNGCDNVEFDVSASISTDGTTVPLDGSPVHVTATPSPGGCHLTIGIALTPTAAGTVYANGQDSWTGTFTLVLSNGKPVTDAEGFAITVYRAGHADDGTPISELTDTVSVSAVTNHGDGTYTVLFTTTVPGTYTARVAYGENSAADSGTMVFAPTPAPPTVTTANATIISGTASPGFLVRVTDAAGNTLGTDIAKGDGSWSIGTPAGVPSQQITASMLSDAGAVLSHVTAWLDTDRPAPPRVDRADTIEVIGDLGAAEPFALVTVIFPGGVQWTTTAGENGSYVALIPAGLNGNVTVTAYQIDTAGNRSASTTVQVAIPLPLPVPTAYVLLPQVRAGETQTVTGKNFRSGEQVSVTCRTCGVLARAAANQSGTVTMSFTVPADTTPGNLTVTLTGALSGSVNVTFEVVAAPAPPAQCWLTTVFVTLWKCKLLRQLF